MELPSSSLFPAEFREFPLKNVGCESDQKGRGQKLRPVTSTSLHRFQRVQPNTWTRKSFEKFHIFLQFYLTFNEPNTSLIHQTVGRFTYFMLNMSESNGLVYIYIYILKKYISPSSISGSMLENITTFHPTINFLKLYFSTIKILKKIN